MDWIDVVELETDSNLEIRDSLLIGISIVALNDIHVRKIICGIINENNKQGLPSHLILML